jgi:hypothetical protein
MIKLEGQAIWREGFALGLVYERPRLMRETQKPFRTYWMSAVQVDLIGWRVTLRRSVPTHVVVEHGDRRYEVDENGQMRRVREQVTA